MWLRIPTSHSSPAMEDSTLPSDALCQRLAVSVSWRGKLLRPQSWRLAWKTEGWRTRLSGLTLPPSQADSSVAAWLDLSVDSPAKTSALPADRQESRENGADCSLRSSDSFASWSPSSGSFLRTSRQFSIFQQEQPFSENLPRSGSMRNGELYECPMLVDRTGESGRLCWPTARSADSESCGNHPWAHCFNGLGAQTAMWRTPAATEEQSDRMSTEAMLRGLQSPNQQINLADQARMWMTPNLALGGRTNTAEQVQAKGKTDNGKRQISLEGQTMHWPTPQARDTKSPDMEGSGNYDRKMENGWTIDLNSAAANWPTPKARDSKSAEGQAGMMRNDPDLNVIASRFSLPVPPTSTHGGKSPSGSTRRLNPDFVDWLMGLIPGWTDYVPLETASYLCRVQSLLRSYLGEHGR